MTTFSKPIQDVPFTKFATVDVSNLPGRRAIVDLLRADNAILSHMPEPLFQLIADHLKPIVLPVGVLTAPYQPVQNVYFPLDGLLAMVSLLKDGATVEVAAGGRLGYLGASLIMREKWEVTQGRVLIAGSASLISADILSFIMDSHPDLRSNLSKFVPMMLARMVWTSTCTARHPIVQRTARWLLSASADMGSPSLVITQEVIAAMLGSRRTGISQILSGWKDDGIITSTRNLITIIDKPRLEAVACECYHEDQLARARHSTSFPAPTPARAAAVHAQIDRYFAL
jgi:CRP-like cAMP-binding protein